MYHLKKYAILLIISAFDLNELTLLNLTDMRSHEYFAPHVVFHNRDCDLEKKNMSECSNSHYYHSDHIFLIQCLKFIPHVKTV